MVFASILLRTCRFGARSRAAISTISRTCGSGATQPASWCSDCVLAALSDALESRDAGSSPSVEVDLDASLFVMRCTATHMDID